MLKSTVAPPSIRLLALDIDGTLLNSKFSISDIDLLALRRAHTTGIEIVLVTGAPYLVQNGISVAGLNAAKRVFAATTLAGSESFKDTTKRSKPSSSIRSQ